ncbi:hypothetical protein SAMN04487934_103197 [Eubacterium ruminantium]|nr:hypothetical protein SAMN04487934_103197 [Eubacterium ruminantium]
MPRKKNYEQLENEQDVENLDEEINVEADNEQNVENENEQNNELVNDQQNENEIQEDNIENNIENNAENNINTIAENIAKNDEVNGIYDLHQEAEDETFIDAEELKNIQKNRRNSFTGRKNEPDERKKAFEDMANQAKVNEEDNPEDDMEPLNINRIKGIEEEERERLQKEAEEIRKREEKEKARREEQKARNQQQQQNQGQNQEQNQEKNREQANNADLEKKRKELELEWEKLRLEQEKLKFEREKFEAEKNGKNPQKEDEKETEKQEKNPEAQPKPKPQPEVKPARETMSFGPTTNAKGYDEARFTKENTHNLAKDIYKLKKLSKLTPKLKKSSPEFKAMRKDLVALDKFMKQISGRTRLSADEMETFDKLTLSVYKTTQTYLKKKAEEQKERKNLGKNEIKSEYEEKRKKYVTRLHNKVNKMREEVFEDLFKKKQEELKGKCQEQINALADDREKIPSLNLDKESLTPTMENNVALTIFYSKRVEQMTSGGEFKLRKGESFEDASKRLNARLEPKESDIKDTLQVGVTQKIVECGINKASKGMPLTNDDIQSFEKKEIVDEARPIINQNIRNANQRPVEVNNEQQRERQLEIPNNQRRL